MQKLPVRNQSIDIYRGLVMFLMMAEVFELSQIAKNIPNSSFWSFLAFHQSHVDWVGCSLHDLIQPSFSFLVGVALPFSMASRLSKGDTFNIMLFHALKRALILILLGVFLRSLGRTMTNWTFEDTLTQIGLGYPFLFLLGFTKQKIQLSAFIFILISYFLAFALYPLPGADFNWQITGNQPGWEHNLKGFAAHWNKNTNFAWAFDNWFMNLFPREKPFLFNRGGYSTLSFIPTLATMILGIFAGEIVKNNGENNQKLKKFLLIGIALLLIGGLLDFSGICPNVKKIWTPTWVLFSGGCCFLLMALFFWLTEIQNKGSWFFLLKVLGLNSIAAYVIDHTLKGFIQDNLPIHFGSAYTSIFGLAYAPLVFGGVVLFIEWWILRWMFKKGIFIKI
jgi:predicted acyltransferase